MKEVPIWEKSNLTLEEAAAYSGIGINKLREITNHRNCRFVLFVGTKRLIKRPCSMNIWSSAVPCKEQVTKQALIW